MLEKMDGAIENIFYKQSKPPPPGKYGVYVVNFHDGDDAAFTVTVRGGGETACQRMPAHSVFRES